MSYFHFIISNPLWPKHNFAFCFRKFEHTNQTTNQAKPTRRVRMSHEITQPDCRSLQWYELRGARASLWSSSAVFVAGLFCTTVLTINFAWGEKWQSYLGINGLRLGYWLPIGDRLIMILITYISDMNGRIGISHFYSPLV